MSIIMSEGLHKISYGGRIFPGSSNRRRPRFEPNVGDDVNLDLNRPVNELLKESFCVSLDITERKGLRLAHLNNVVRILTNIQNNSNGVDERWSGFSVEEILLAVRSLLVDDEKAVRAASIRILRYLIRSGQELHIALKLHMDLFILRSLELVIDNQVEREHCFRLIGHLLVVYSESCHEETKSKSSLFPVSCMRTLVALCNESYRGTATPLDSLCYSSLGLICEMSIRSPDLVLGCASTGWLIKALLTNHQPVLIDTLIGVMVNWIDCRTKRKRPDVQIMLQELLAPLTDETFSLSWSDKPSNDQQSLEQPEIVLETSKCAIISVLRTWPGLLAFLSEGSVSTPSPLRLLVDGLGLLDNERNQETILDLFCELLQFSYTWERFSNWEHAVIYKCSGSLLDTNRSYYKEALSLLQNSSYNRVDLIGSLRSLALFAIIEAGLPHALVRLILVNPDSRIAIKSTLLLSDLLKTGANELPNCWRCQLLTLPSVIQAFCDTTHGYAQRSFISALSGAHSRSFALITAKNAHILSGRLDHLDSLASTENNFEPNNFQLEMLLRRHGKDKFKGHFSITTVAFGAYDGTLPSPEKLHEFMRESRVNHPYTNPIGGWDWAYIDLALCQLERIGQKHWLLLQKHFEDDRCQKFLIQVINFFQPQSRQFSKLDKDWRNYSRTGCRLMRVVGQSKTESTLAKVLLSFLLELHQLLLPANVRMSRSTSVEAAGEAISFLLSMAASVDKLHVGMLSPKNLVSTCCADYFAFIGELTSTENGYKLLERTGLLQRFLDLLGPDTDDLYVKVIISGLDCARPGLCRTILQKALTSTKDKSRRYATKHLHVLGLLRPALFEQWGIEMLAMQLADTSSRVACKAVQILHDLLSYKPYKEAFVRLKSPVLPLLGDGGILLETYFLGSEKFVNTDSSGYSFMRSELSKWRDGYDLRYVDIVEEMLRTELSSLRRGNDGSFRRYSSNRTISQTFWLPPHPLGQLVQHSTGCYMLAEDNLVQSLLYTVQFGKLATEEERRKMKAALWSLGHLGSTAESLITVLPHETVPILVKIAEECPYLSIRGVAYWSLNLIGLSAEGAQRLVEVGWESSSFIMSNPDDANRENHGRSRSETLLSNFEREITLNEVYVNCCQDGGRESGSRRDSTKRASLHLTLPSKDLKPRSRSVGAEERRRPLTPVSDHSPSATDNTKEGRSLSLSKRFYTAASQRTLRKGFSEDRSSSGVHNQDWLESSDRNRYVSHPSVSPTSGFGSLGDTQLDMPSPLISDIPSPSSNTGSFLTPNATPVPRGVIRSRKRVLSINDNDLLHPSWKLREKLGLEAKCRMPRTVPTLVSDMRLPRRPNPYRLLSDEEASGLEVWQNVETDTELQLLSGHQKELSTNFGQSVLDEYVSSYKSTWPELAVGDLLPPATAIYNRGQHHVVLPADISQITWGVISGSNERLGLGSLLSVFSKIDTNEDRMITSRMLSVTSTINRANSEVAGFGQHKAELCFRCAPKGLVQFSVGESESGIEDGSFSEPARSRAGTHVSQASSTFETEDTECSTEDSGGSKTLLSRDEIRKEVLSLVCVLDVRKRFAEQALLKLRQDQSFWFSGPCLYCDVCALLAKYQFQWSSRRFVQELFQEQVDFSQLWIEPLRIFAGVDPRSKLDTVISADTQDDDT